MSVTAGKRRQLCGGVGMAPWRRGDSIYPHCSVCGREFSAAGKKARVKWGNLWTDGIPRHFVEVPRGR